MWKWVAYCQRYYENPLSSAPAASSSDEPLVRAAGASLRTPPMSMSPGLRQVLHLRRTGLKTPRRRFCHSRPSQPCCGVRYYSRTIYAEYVANRDRRKTLPWQLQQNISR